MKKSLLLVAVAAFLLMPITSCTDNMSIAVYADGQRVEVKNTMYSVGDTVYVQETTSNSGTRFSISQSYWKDTTMCTNMKTLYNNDELVCWSFTKAVIIK